MWSWTRLVWRGRHPPPAAARRKPGRPKEARPPGGALREQRGLDDARRTRPVAPLFPQREGLLAFRLLLPAFLLLPRRPLCSQSQLTTGGCARPGARAAGVAGRDLAGMLADPKALYRVVDTPPSGPGDHREGEGLWRKGGLLAGQARALWAQRLQDRVGLGLLQGGAGGGGPREGVVTAFAVWPPRGLLRREAHRGGPHHSP